MLTITTKQKPRGLRIGVYGTHGIGKTTLVAGILGCLVVSCEDGAGNQEYPQVSVHTWEQLIRVLEEIRDNPPPLPNGSPIRFLAIDTVSTAEKLAIRSVTGKEISLDDVGEFAKGAKQVGGHFLRFYGILEEISIKGIHVIGLCHATLETIRPPDSADYQKWSPALDQKYVCPGFVRWLDVLLFACSDVVVSARGLKGQETEASVTKKGKVTKEDRRLYCVGSAYLEAKNRYGLPESIGLSWAEFAKLMKLPEIEKELLAYIESNKPKPPVDLKPEIKETLLDKMSVFGLEEKAVLAAIEKSLSRVTTQNQEISLNWSKNSTTEQIRKGLGL